MVSFGATGRGARASTGSASPSTHPWTLAAPSSSAASLRGAMLGMAEAAFTTRSVMGERATDFWCVGSCAAEKSALVHGSPPYSLTVCESPPVGRV